MWIINFGNNEEAVYVDGYLATENDRLDALVKGVAKTTPSLQATATGEAELFDWAKPYTVYQLTARALLDLGFNEFTTTGDYAWPQDPTAPIGEDPTFAVATTPTPLWQTRREEFANPCHNPEDGKFCGEGAHYLPDHEQHVLTATQHPKVRALVGRMLSHRRQVENGYTDALSTVAKANGGEMLGLANKFKEAKGVIGKIERKVRDKGISPEKAAEGIGDALRYTMSFPPDKYVDGIKSAVKALQDKGVSFVDFEDNWIKGDAYNGVNAVFKDKKTGLKVELQFHTPDSWDVKGRRIHKDYEFVRENRGTPAQRLLAFERMRTISDSIQFPKGIDSLCKQLGSFCKRLFRPNTETLFASAEKTVPVNTLQDIERLLKEGIASQDDYEEFIDGYLGFGPPFPGYIYPNTPEARKQALAAKMERGTNA